MARVNILASIAGATLIVAAWSAEGALQDPHDSPAVQLAADGLRLLDVESGGAERLGFGTPQDDAVEALSAALGDPEGSDHNPDCDAGPTHLVDFQGGLRLFFRAGEFVGWSTDGGWSATNGIAVGMT